MDESVFGAGFDLQDYIHKRSLDIQALRERALYRQVTDTVLHIQLPAAQRRTGI